MEGVHKYVLVLIISALIQQVLGKQQVVGEAKAGMNLQISTLGHRVGHLRSGDQLVFKYTTGLHSVVELGSETAYKSCDITTALDSMNGGNDVVKLNKPGTRYFACGTPGHCGQGMKVKITTVAAGASSNSPTTSSSSSPSTTSTSKASGSGLHYFAPFGLVALLSGLHMIFFL